MIGDRHIGFIGGGVMATTLISGFLQTKTFDKDHIHVYDISEARTKYFKEEGIKVNDGIPSLVDSCDIVVFAVKPDILLSLLNLKLSNVESFTPDKLFISIACGITIKQISDKIQPSGAGIVRLLPNTPCRALKGICCYTLGPNTDEKTSTLMKDIFSNVAETLQIPEYYMDAVVALAGSGPAFIYMLIEALADGGVRSGLPRDLALYLSAYMVRGAAEMVITTRNHPAELKDQVCSPGGTSIAGVEYLEQHGFRGDVLGAVFAAFCREKEIGNHE